MNKLLTGGAVACAAVLLCAAVSNEPIKREYTVRTDKVSGVVRIAQISDLHDCMFGEGQSKLISMLISARPDVIVLTGDIIEDTQNLKDGEPDIILYKNHPARLIIEAALKLAPVYMVLGNHEANIACRERLLHELTSLGVRLVGGEKEYLQVKGGEILICGADDPRFGGINARVGATMSDKDKPESAGIGTERSSSHILADDVGYIHVKPRDADSEGFIKGVSRHIDEDCNKDTTEINSWRGQLIHEYSAVARSRAYTLLLSHRPEEYRLYRGLGFDAAMSGHAHGGQWRLPPLINGVYAPHQGIFPSHAGGVYRYDDDRFVHIVSRGLSTKRCVRICNRPELCVLRLLPRGRA